MVSCLTQMLGTILLVFMLAQAQGNQGGGAIHGQILIPSVRAAERIQVIVQKSDGPIVARVFSDSLGNYDVRNLASGSYDIIVNVEVKDSVRYVDYTRAVGPTLDAYGGRFVVRGGRAEKLEGSWEPRRGL